MANVKFRAREFTPKANQAGVHSFYAEAVVDNTIDNQNLADKIEARTGFKAYEVKAIIEAIADIVAEETLENNRVTMSNKRGTQLLSIYPKVSGSVSDNDVKAQNGAGQKYEGKQVATEDMLTADMLQWTLGCTVGANFSRDFAQTKKAVKVKTTTTAADTSDSGTDSGSGSQGGSQENPLGELEG